MAVTNHTKTSPVGIDSNIQALQTKLYTDLVNSWGITTGDFYGRCDLLDKDGLRLPCWFESGKDYTRILYNDNVSVSSLFYIDDTTATDDFNTVSVKLFFSFDLADFYGSITHRPDEEVLRDIVLILEKEPFDFKLNQIVRNYSSLSDFTVPEKQYNCQDKFTVRFDLELKYNYSNC